MLSILLEMSQLADTNSTRSAALRNNMQDFLGLTKPLAAIPHHRPNAQHEKRLKETVEKSKGRARIDICDDEHDKVRKELMRIPRSASTSAASAKKACRNS